MPQEAQPRTPERDLRGCRLAQQRDFGCEVKDLEVATMLGYPGSIAEGGQDRGRPCAGREEEPRPVNPLQDPRRGKEVASPWGLLREVLVLPSLALSPKLC